VVIDKPGKGAFHQTDLDQVLKNARIDTLMVAGVTTEVCVHTTIREANDRGYRCVALADACASYFPEFHRVGLEMIKAQGGIFGWVSDSAALATALADSPIPANA
ncbi:MAG: cysteine hydrolase, partial [Pseudomonadota bacterium]